MEFKFKQGLLFDYAQIGLQTNDQLTVQCLIPSLFLSSIFFSLLEHRKNYLSLQWALGYVQTTKPKLFSG